MHIFRIELKHTEHQFFESTRIFYAVLFLVRWSGFALSWYVRCSNRSSLMQAFVCGCYLSFYWINFIRLLAAMSKKIASINQ